MDLTNGKTAVVTGPGGLTGTYLVKLLLEKGYNVRVLVRSEKARNEILNFLKNNKLTFEKIEFFKGDIRQYKDIERIIFGANYIFHNAAFVSLNPHKKKKIFETNIIGTRNVVDALCKNENHSAKLIHFSSIAALGAPNKNGTVNEQCNNFINKNNNTYSISKYYAELEVWRGMEEGLNMVIINPSVILGFNSSCRSSSVLLSQMKRNIPFLPDGVTGYVNVEDVCQVAVLLAESNISGKRFVISAQNLTFVELFNMIRTAIGKPLKARLINRRLIITLAYLTQLVAKIFRKEPLISPQMIKTALSKTYYDGSLICSEIDFEYIQIEKTVEKWNNSQVSFKMKLLNK